MTPIGIAECNLQTKSNVLTHSGGPYSSFGTVARPESTHTAIDDQNTREPRNRGMLGRSAAAPAAGAGTASSARRMKSRISARHRPTATPAAIHSDERSTEN